MPEIILKTSVGGSIEGHHSPKPGDVIEVSEEAAEAWADGVRAERVKPVEPPAPKKSSAKKTAKKGSKKAETAGGDSGPEKRG